MQKQTFLFFLFLLLYGMEAAHTQKATPTNNYADLGAGFGSSQGSISGAYINNWQIGKKKTFFIGVGARFSLYFGKDIDFLSAPAKLASDVKSTDTLFIANPSVSALNILVNMGINITPKLQAGFNIDVIGFSFGGNETGKFTGNGNTVSTYAKPSSFNLLLVGNNDIGSLNSHFYLQYAISRQWGIKAAYQYMFTEFTTDNKVQVSPEANDRFRNKASMVYAGLVYSF